MIKVSVTDHPKGTLYAKCEPLESGFYKLTVQGKGMPTRIIERTARPLDVVQSLFLHWENT